MDNKICIYSERCWINGKLQPATVCFADGVITEILPVKFAGAVDAGNLILMPGIIDAHVHINEPGRTEWEGFDTATKAAAAGGITTIVDMPLNASPVTTTVKAFSEKLAASENKLHVNVGFYGGLVPGNTSDIAPLAEAGVLGIKCFLVHSGIDEFPEVKEKDIAEAMPVIAKYDLPLLAHCEVFEKEVVNDFAAHPNSYSLYLESRPSAWEKDAVQMMLRLCRNHQCPVHIVHVSAAEALPLISAAKKEGLPVTAETCAHYIYFNAEDIPDANCLYKCAPPIRNRENNNKLKSALLDGTLDFLATDHSPAPPAIKELQSGNIRKAWGGIAGLQFLLPATWTALKGSMSLEKFIPLLTSQPAAFLQVSDRKGALKVGYDADLVLWDPEYEEKVTSGDILFRHKVSPYIGETLSGSIRQTYVNGKLVYNNKQIIHKNSGKWLLRK